MTCRASVLCMIGIFLLSLSVAAQKKTGLGEDSPDQWQSGEVGYKAGCSFAASKDIKKVCGELPSGKQAQQDQNAADASAAIAVVQQLQGEAAGVSATSSQLLEQQDSQDSADTSAATAVIQQAQQAADKVVAATPDVFTVERPYAAEPTPDKIPAYTPAQRALAWGVAGIPGQETQNTPPAESPTSDAVPAVKQEVQQADQEKINQYSNALQQYQDAIQQVSDLAFQHMIKNPSPTPQQVQRGYTPSVSAAPPVTPSTTPSRCAQRGWCR